MIIEMPFLHRMRAATKKTPEARDMAAWDKERFALSELSSADFEPGAEAGSLQTITAEGKHWARLTDIYPDHGVYDHGQSPVDWGLRMLAGSIDCTRFFARGREKIAQTSTLRKPPAVELIEMSERETNVSNVAAWLAHNLVSVDGVPYTRVKEPSSYMSIVGPFDAERCFIEIKLSTLVAELDERYEHGIMSTISGTHALLRRAQGIMSSDRRIMRVDNNISRATLDSMVSYCEDPALMAARTLEEFSRRTEARWFRQNGTDRLVKSMRAALSMPGGVTDQVRMDVLADIISKNVSTMDYPRDIMAEIVLEGWYNRPVNIQVMGFNPTP